MNPPVFQLVSANTACVAVLGSNPTRFYPWGRAPQNTPKPYAVYTVYNAVPENYLGDLPDIDNKGTQINIYADNPKDLNNAFIAIRNCLEPNAHMTNFSSFDPDNETDLYTIRMEFDFWDDR